MRFSWIIKTERTMYNPMFGGEDIDTCINIGDAYDYQTANNAISYIASMIKKEGLNVLCINAQDIDNFNNSESYLIYKSWNGYSFHKVNKPEIFTEKSPAKIAKLVYEYALQEIKTQYIDNPAMNASA